MATLLLIALAAAAMICLGGLIHLAVTIGSDLRHDSNKLKQIRKERDEMWARYTRNYLEREG